MNNVEITQILDINKIKYKQDLIKCDISLVNLIKKDNLNLNGIIEIKRGNTADDKTIQTFCLHNGFLLLIISDKYLCINYKIEHKNYEYVGCGTSCRVFKYKNIALKIFHNYTEDYYKDLEILDQNFIKFPKRIFNSFIEYDNSKIHIIEETFIKSDKSISQQDFVNKMESFIPFIQNIKKFPKIDLHYDNLKINCGNIYLVDTHKRNKSENNDFIIDKKSWGKYKQKTITIKGHEFLETYSSHNIIIYEKGELKLKSIINKNYNDYHNIENTIGKRECSERIKHFNISDIKGKTILDIGCSMGGMMIEAIKNGAKKCTGLEYNKDSVNFLKNYCIKNRIKNIDIKLQDIDDFDWFRNIEKVDTVFLLSILNTSNFSEKDSLISISNRLGKVLYIEGHSGENHLSYLKKLYYHTDYTKFEHSYVTDGLGKRPLIRCSYDNKFLLNKKDFNL